MNQSFNRQQLLRLCKQTELVDYGATLSNDLENSYNDIVADTFEFKITQLSEYFLAEDLPNKLILRKLNDNIKRIYKDEQANRRIIISQVKTLLSETCPFWVIKTDIKSFYESINRDRLISKFHDDSILSYQSMFLLRKVFSNSTLTTNTGVPRGMNISATLSEIYMRKFDKWVRIYSGVYYYARFVDDIIIFTNSLSNATSLIESLNENLSELAEGLKINSSKTELYDGKNLKHINPNDGKVIRKGKTLEYLGYSFFKETEKVKKPNAKSFQNVEDLKYTVETKYSTLVTEPISKINFNEIKSSQEAFLRISIADKKVKKIKTRVVKALLDYPKNKNFDLLENRIKFLTGNYSIRKNEEGNTLRAGIYYNYLHVNQYKIFIELNSFFRKALFSNLGNFGLKVGLSKPQKQKLSKYCFVAGFENKVHNEFDYSEMQNIIQCW